MLSRTAFNTAGVAAATAPWHMMHSRPPASVTACRYSTASFSLRHQDPFCDCSSQNEACACFVSCGCCTLCAQEMQATKRT